jgi:hypothetical protein
MLKYKKCQAHVGILFCPINEWKCVQIQVEQLFFLHPQSKYGFLKFNT